MQLEPPFQSNLKDPPEHDKVLKQQILLLPLSSSIHLHIHMHTKKGQTFRSDLEEAATYSPTG